MIKFILLSLFIFNKSFSEMPLIPLIPATPIEYEEKKDEGIVKRKLEKNSSLMVKLQCDVIVPLEIVSDIDIKALIIEEEDLEIPFDIEFNKIPEHNKNYKLHFSETKIDIDKDGTVDTEIFYSKNLNKQKISDNYVKITGKNISQEGTHKKKIYITVEVDD
ncbi:MAG: hypothetical protein ACRC1R_05615 [Cetobacterium sp.]|uniref:hypothetical protein n=1 Tax=Cetobacterium sp. TaxID=2071632 RepID=UPI003F3DCC30